jgi:hypothetical protein
MTVYGGTRDRLIRESIYWELHRVLDALGWLDHVTFVPEPQDNSQKIQANTLALSEEDTTPTEAEMGSNLAVYTKTYYLDFYAANQAMAIDVTGDLAAALEGKLPDAGRNHPGIEVLDYRLATPTPLFVVDVTRVTRDRTLNPTKPWLQHWHMVRFFVEDEH